MLSLAVDEDIVSVNPAAGVKVQHADEREGRILTTDEIGTLVDAMDDRYRALVLLMAYRGLRIGEAIYLRVKHFERDAGPSDHRGSSDGSRRGADRRSHEDR
jgi:site-specific recombinase XerC